MKIARVTGTVVSTVKYEKYRGYKLLKVRHLTLEGEHRRYRPGQQRRRRGPDGYG